MPTLPQYKTSVHLVVYNGEAYLPFCLTGLAQQLDKDFLLLIIDNASMDDSLRVVNEFINLHPDLAKRTRIVRNNKNIGFARAHNQAIHWTSSDYVMFLNQDVVLQPDYLSRLVNCLESAPKVGAVQGKILKWRTRGEVLTMPDKSALGTIDTCGLRINKNRRVVNWRQGEQGQPDYKEAIEIFGVDGAAPLYRRLSLEAVSYQQEILDENFVAYKEDVDLAWRLKTAGWEAWLETKAIAWHDRSLQTSGTLRTLWQQRQRWPKSLRIFSCRNHWLLLVKNDCLVNFFKHSPIILWYEIKKFIYRLILEPIVLFKALGQFFVLLPNTLVKRKVIKKSKVITCLDIRKWLV